MIWRDSSFSIDKDFPETSDSGDDNTESAIPSIPEKPEDSAATTLLIQQVMTGLTTKASSSLVDIPVDVNNDILDLETFGKTLNFSARGIFLNLYG